MRLADSRKFDSTAKGMVRACLGVALIVACLAVPTSNYATTLKHQASGTIESHTPSAIVLLKHVGQHKTQWDFMLTHETQIPPGVVKGVRVTIYYHEDGGHRIADRIKVVAVSGAK